VVKGLAIRCTTYMPRTLAESLPLKNTVNPESNLAVMCQVEEEQQFFEQEVVPDLRRRQDPIFQLYQEELGRTPDAAGYRYYQEEFGQPAYITDRMRQDFLGGGGYGGSREIPDQMGSAFRELMGRDPTSSRKTRTFCQGWDA
jgi:hypothetical protein